MTVTADSDRTGPYQQAASDPHWCDCRPGAPLPVPHTGSGGISAEIQQRTRTLAGTPSRTRPGPEDFRRSRAPAPGKRTSGMQVTTGLRLYFRGAQSHSPPFAPSLALALWLPVQCWSASQAGFLVRLIKHNTNGCLVAHIDANKKPRLNIRLHPAFRSLPLSWDTTGKADRELHTCD